MTRIESADDDRLINARYRLVEVIGQGGMGTVWHGHDEMLDREVAIKEIRLPPELSDEERSLLSERAKREARATAGLSHPGVITVHDVIEHDGAPMIVMEYIDGRSLAEAIKEAVKLPWRRVAEIGADMLDALRAAHAAGIVHRDLKPGNVLLSGDRVIITDFGIAHRSGETTLSEPGEMVGTPAFMAPEQAEHATATPASDLWSLGATLFAAVEGRPPYTGPDFVTTLLSLLTQEPPEPRNAGPLGPVIGSLLRKDPARRATAESTAGALDTILHDDTTPASPPTPPPTTPPAPAATSASSPARPRPKTPRPPNQSPARAHPAPAFQPRRPSQTRRRGPKKNGAGALTILVIFAVVIYGLFLTHRSGSGATAYPQHSVNSVAMSADGGTVAVALSNGVDGTIRLWHTADRKPFAALPIDAWALAFSPDGKTLAVDDGSDIRLLDLASHREERSVLTADTVGNVTALAFSSDGTTITYASNSANDTYFGTWRTDTSTVTAASTGVLCDVDALSRDGSTLACSTGSHPSLDLWDVGTRGKTTVTTNTEAQAVALDGDTLATVEAESIALSSIREKQPEGTLPAGTSVFGQLAFAANGKLVGVDLDGKLHLWNVLTHKQLAQWSATGS